MKLTEEDVQKILDLVDKSNFAELHLQDGDFQLTLIKGGSDPTVVDRYAPIIRVESGNNDEVSPSELQQKMENPVIDQKQFAEKKREAAAAAAEGTLSITAPVIGTFYSSPEPGAPPFVKPGVFVEEDSTVCLIETMKVFTSVKAGLRGYIEEVCAENTQMVEYGQTLFKVRPE